MAFSEIELKRHEKTIKSYLDRVRPPPHIRKELDLGFRQHGQSVEVFEIRPMWRHPDEILENSVAKATYVKSRKVWKIFWQRADLKWHSYEPVPFVKSLDEFIEVIEADSYGCFFG